MKQRQADSTSWRYATFTWMTLSLLYFMQRSFTFAVLAGTGTTGATTPHVKGFSIGFLSDIWVAALWGALVLFWGLLFRTFRQTWKGRRLDNIAAVPIGFGIVVIGNGIACAMHQAYIDFFHTQIVPYHLSYIFDADFLRANSHAAWRWQGIATGAASIGLATVICRADPLRHLRRRRWIAGYCLAFGLSLLAHNRNIHWRVQQFVPTNLQTNMWEHLYLAIRDDRTPNPLNTEDWQVLVNSFGGGLPSSTIPESQKLAEFLFSQNASMEIHRSGLAKEFHGIRDAFQTAIASGKKPLAIGLLVESLRPIDLKIDPSRQSLTPEIHQLQKEPMISWTNAHTSGTVTRGAQEAIFCGFPGSETTSAMRNRTDLELQCLPQKLANKATTLWLHGGEGRFDNQEAFWDRHGVDVLMSQKDFSPESPRTGWGVGDRTFLRKAQKTLEETRHTSTNDALLAMVLTVSNHTPWHIPADGESLPFPEAATHPSHQTIFYTDAAVGGFVRNLKQSGLWEETVLILASDHGHLAPPYHGGDISREALRTHMVFMLSGGLVQEVVRKPTYYRWPVAQTDIAVFLAQLFGVSLPKAMGDNPFRKDRRFPVLSDLGKRVYNPVTQKVYSSTHIRGLETPQGSTDKAAVLYFRAFLRQLNFWNEDGAKAAVP